MELNGEKKGSTSELLLGGRLHGGLTTLRGSPGGNPRACQQLNPSLLESATKTVRAGLLTACPIAILAYFTHNFALTKNEKPL